MTSTMRERALREHLKRLQKDVREGEYLLRMIDSIMNTLRDRVSPDARLDWEEAVLERRYAEVRRRSLTFYIEQVERELALAQAGEAVA